MRIPLSLAFLFAALPACAANPPPTGIAPPTRIPGPPVEPPPAGVEVTIASVPRALRRAAVADAARRFKVAPNDVVLTYAEQVTWKDSALGCPEPGVMYLQSLQPGFRMIAKSRDRTIVYNTDGKGRLVVCAPR